MQVEEKSVFRRDTTQTQISNEPQLDPLDQLISNFAEMKLKESDEKDKVFATFYKNSHGFLQRTISKKSASRPNNLLKILNQLHQIYLNREDNSELGQMNPSKLLDDLFTNPHHPDRLNQSMHSLNFSNRKRSLSGLQTPKARVDRSGQKSRQNEGLCAAGLNRELFTITDTENIVNAPVLEALNEKSTPNKVRRVSCANSVSRLNTSCNNMNLLGDGVSHSGLKERVGAEVRSKLSLVHRKIQKLGMSSDGPADHKSLFRLGIYKSFPKRMDLIYDVVKIFKKNRDEINKHYDIKPAGRDFRNCLGVLVWWLNAVAILVFFLVD